MDDLAISCRVSVPDGWLEVNDGRAYRLAADSFAASQRTWRRQDVQSPYIDGTYTVNAVLENVVLPLSLYVYGADHGDMERKLDVLLGAFEQYDYVLQVDRGDHRRLYYCQTADSTVDTKREFQHAKMALVTFQVPTRPERAV